MEMRTVDGALDEHVDVKDAYRMAHGDVLALCKMISLETRMHGRYAKKAGLNFAHVGDLAAIRRSLVEVLTQLSQQDKLFVWKRLAEGRERRK